MYNDEVTSYDVSGYVSKDTTSYYIIQGNTPTRTRKYYVTRPENTFVVRKEKSSYIATSQLESMF